MFEGLRKKECISLDAFSEALYSLNRRGFVNVGHHVPSALDKNQYIICTHPGCRACGNSTGLSIVWWESVQFKEAS